MKDNNLKGILKFNEPLARYTSWHVGGNADRYYCPADIIDLTIFLTTLDPIEPLTWLGLGSNVLIADAGLKGTVIHTLGMLPSEPTILSQEPNPKLSSNLELTKEKENIENVNAFIKQSVIEDPAKQYTLVRAEASIPCAKLAKFCAKRGLVGGEFFAGIPGTVGGALTMNAGAFGGETWEKVQSVELINRKGERIIRYPDEYQIAYRSVQNKAKNEEWFVAAHFQFATGDATKAQEQIKTLLRKRSSTQPIGVFSCGSVFKNPPGDYAGRLIEACGLKGLQMGGAQISEKHANFIINQGKAKASEVLQLIQHIQQTVYAKYAISLQTEVRMLGF